MPFLWEQCSQNIFQRLLSESYRIPGTEAKNRRIWVDTSLAFPPNNKTKQKKYKKETKAPFVFCHQEVSSVYSSGCVCMFIFTELRQPCPWNFISHISLVIRFPQPFKHVFLWKPRREFSLQFITAAEREVSPAPHMGISTFPEWHPNHT